MRPYIVALAAATLWAVVGTAALTSTERMLVDGCHQPLTQSQRAAAIPLWPITLGAAAATPPRC